MHRENGKRTRKGFGSAVDLKKERIKNKIRETQFAVTVVLSWQKAKNGGGLL